MKRALIVTANLVGLAALSTLLLLQGLWPEALPAWHLTNFTARAGTMGAIALLLGAAALQANLGVRWQRFAAAAGVIVTLELLVMLWWNR